MCMHMRQFTRLTNAFSKKIKNHCYAVVLHFIYFNFVKIHSTLKITLASASSVVDFPKVRGSYKKLENIV